MAESLRRWRTSAMVATTIAVLLLLLWGSFVYGLWRSRVEALSYAVGNTQRLTQLLESHAERMFDGASLLLFAAENWYRTNPDADLRTDGAFRLFADTMLRQAGAVRSLTVVDRQAIGHVVAGGQLGDVAPLGDRDYVRVWSAPRPHTAYVGTSQRSRVDGEWVLPVSLAVSDAGSPMWVMVVELPLTAINNLYRSILVARSDAASLMRTDGTLLTREPFADVNIGRALANGRIFVKYLPEASRGVFDEVVVIDGKRRLVGYSQVGTTELVVVFSQETEVALADWWRSLTLYLGVFGAITGVVIILGFFVVRLIQRDEASARAQREALLAAEAGSRAKSTFLATISHELRTPLNSILGFSSLLADQVHGPLGATQYQGYAKDIQNSGTYLMELIEDMLDAVRLEAGALKLTPEPADLAAEIDSSFATIRPDAERRRITLRSDCAADLPPLELDRRALRRILLNLLGNAVKFTNAGGTITAGAVLRDGMITLTVSDTGIGIAPDKIALLGKPFVQVDDSLTRRHAGSGLGLAICKGLAETMGGSLTITSEVGEGTVVTVSFPVQRAPSNRGASARSAAA